MKSYFPESGFNQNTILLPRQRLVDDCFRSLKNQLKKKTIASTYISGMRGSGKTSFLQLLAIKFSQSGIPTYFFSSMSDFNCVPLIEHHFPKEKNATVVIFIDDVSEDAEYMYGYIIGFLKHPDSLPCQVVVVGAGAPTAPIDGFSNVIRSEFLLTDDGEEMTQLMNYWAERRPDMDRSVLEQICKYVRYYCGGHLLSTAKCMEFAFDNPTWKDEGGTANLLTFKKHFLSEAFTRHRTYKEVIRRCFGHPIDKELLKASLGVLRSVGSVSLLWQYGWWTEQGFVSPLVRSYILSCVKYENSVSEAFRNQFALRMAADELEKVETLIVTGLQNMLSQDFEWDRNCITYASCRVDGLSSAWAIAIKKCISGVSFHFRSRAKSQHTDFHCSGCVDCAIVILLDAVNNNLTEYASGIRTEQYLCESWCILNFALSNPLVLPDDASTHSRIYTFVQSENALYQGNTLIKQPAVERLPSIARHDYLPLRQRRSQDGERD